MIQIINYESLLFAKSYKFNINSYVNCWYVLASERF